MSDQGTRIAAPQPNGGKPARTRRREASRKRPPSPARDRFAYRPGNGLCSIERLEDRQLLSSDLTQSISDLILKDGVISGQHVFSDVSIGNFVTAPQVTVGLNLTETDASHWTGTISVDATSAQLNFNSAVTGSITSANSTDALTGSYTLTNEAPGQGLYSLTAQDIKLTAGNAFTAEAKPVTLSYDTQGAVGQTVATIGSATATFQPLNNATATVTNLVVRDNGFSLGDATVSASSFSLGGILSATSPSVSFSGVSYTDGGSLAGTVSVGASTVSILSNESNFANPGGASGGNGNGLTLSGFTGSYGVASGDLAIGATGAELKLGKLVDATASGVTLNYNPAASSPVTVGVGSLTATSPLLPGVTGTITNLSASSSGLSMDNATLADPNTFSMGTVLQVQGLSVGVTGFSYNTASHALAGTILASTTGVTLFPGQSAFTDSVTNLHGSYNLQNGTLGLTADDVNLAFGKILDADATNVAVGWDGTTATFALGTATLTSPLFPGVTGSFSGVTVDNTGVKIDGATLEDSGTIHLGNVFDVTDLKLGVSGLVYDAPSKSITAGTVTISNSLATLFPNAMDFTDSVTNFHGSDNIATGAFSLTADDINLSFGKVLKADATNVGVNWDGTSASFTVGTATLTSPELPGVTGSLAGLSVQSTGFDIASASLTDTNSIILGSVIKLDGPTTVSVTNLDYINGTSTSSSILTGTIGLSFGGLEVLPGSTAFSTTVTGFSGTYNLATQETDLTVGSIDVVVGSGSNGSSTADPIFTVDATGVSIDLTPDGNGNDIVDIKVGTATAALNKFADVNGNVTDLEITNDGFSVGSATLNVNGTTTGSTGKGTISAFGGKFMIVNPSVTLSGFGYKISTGAFTAQTLSLSADEVDFNQGGSVAVSATGLTTTISFASGDVGHTIIKADTFDAAFKPYLTLTASSITIDTSRLHRLLRRVRQPDGHADGRLGEPERDRDRLRHRFEWRPDVRRPEGFRKAIRSPSASASRPTRRPPAPCSGRAGCRSRSPRWG